MEPAREKMSDFPADSMGEKPSENGFTRSPDPEKQEGAVRTVHLKRKLQSRHLQMIGKRPPKHLRSEPLLTFKSHWRHYWHWSVYRIWGCFTQCGTSRHVDRIRLCRDAGIQCQ